MRLLLAWSIFAITMLPLLAQDPSARADDRASIREVVREYVAARDHADAKEIEALFTVDADQLVSERERRRAGRCCREAPCSVPRERTIYHVDQSPLRPGVAIADGRYEVTGSSGGPSRKMWTTLVMRQGEDGWHIAAIRNMLPAPPAQ